MLYNLRMLVLARGMKSVDIIQDGIAVALGAGVSESLCVKLRHLERPLIHSIALHAAMAVDGM